MVAIELRIDDFEDGALPHICVSSGRPTRTLYYVIAYHQPWWPALFLVLGPIGIVLALGLMIGLRRSVPGYLPFDDEVQQVSQTSRRSRYLAALVCGAVGTSVVLVAGGAGYTKVAIIAGVVGAVATVGCLVAAERPRGAVGLKLVHGGRWVAVRGAAPDFAEAYTRQEQRRRAARGGAILRP